MSSSHENLEEKIVRYKNGEKDVVFSPASDLDQEVKEMLSPENRWFTGEEVEHDPTPDECALYYIRSGAAQRFREKQNSLQAPSPLQVQAQAS